MPREVTNITRKTIMDYRHKLIPHGCIYILLLYVFVRGHPKHNLHCDKMARLSIAAWNLRCNLGCAGPYLHTLADMADIIAVSEHGLYHCELRKLDDVHPEYLSLAKASKQLNDVDFGHKRAHGGCALLWNKRLSSRIRPLPNLGSDRICVIQINVQDINYYVVAAYMPHHGCKIAEFNEEIAILEQVCNECRSTTMLLILVI